MDRDRTNSILEQANELLEAGKPAETLTCLAQLEGQLVEADDRIEYGTLRAWALSEVGRTDEALAALEPLIEEFPDSARIHGTRGVVLSNAEELGAAREALEHAVELDEEDDVAVANLALVCEKQGDFESAVRLYDRAIELGAEIDWALARKAGALNELGDFGAAKATLRRYLSLAPDDVEQWIGLAILHSDDEEYDEAFNCYRRAEQIEPASPALRLNWGVTAVRAGRLKQARRQLRYLQELAPQSVRPHLLKAFICEEEGKLDAARKCYEEALACLPGSDREELLYGLEMAMDFYSRQRLTDVCERLLEQAYIANACTVELCEAHREALGTKLDEAAWFSLVLEADYRPGLPAPAGGDASPDSAARRFTRNFQVVAKDRDDAIALAVEFAERMGETNVRVCEFAGEEPLSDAYAGLYEVDPRVFVFADDPSR